MLSVDSKNQNVTPTKGPLNHVLSALRKAYLVCYKKILEEHINVLEMKL